MGSLARCCRVGKRDLQRFSRGKGVPFNDLLPVDVGSCVGAFGVNRLASGTEHRERLLYRQQWAKQKAQAAHSQENVFHGIYKDL